MNIEERLNVGRQTPMRKPGDQEWSPLLNYRRTTCWLCTRSGIDPHDDIGLCIICKKELRDT